MKKHLRNWLGLFCFALLACLWGAAPLQAAGNTVLVLPFQVTAGPEMPNAARDVPLTIIRFPLFVLAHGRSLITGIFNVPAKKNICDPAERLKPVK